MAALSPASPAPSSSLSSVPSSVVSTPAPAAPASAPAPPAKPDEKELYNTDSRLYSRTCSTFIKRELPPERRRRDSNGDEIVDPFIKKLFELEALALKVLSSKSKIKVPRLVDGGLDENGLAFVETELWDGISGAQVIDKCRMRDGERHVDTGKCTMCHDKAWANADSYIANVVLPEFEKLMSKETMGPDDKLDPPPWMRYHGHVWVRKISDADGYVFTDWDLSPNNIMFKDNGTLDVMGAYDWEGSAFLPPDFHTANCSQQELDALLVQFESETSYGVIDREGESACTKTVA